ncbi:hypothetical protein [Helicobacter muridarum]|uniref:Uncharacterized protein n=1 Tax=Helicobacter muridarum TaxID=216 RepID=A0A377PSC4_9HELI|nr:hypothetical protein [Helicobacter muridarum]STQ85379.1 Uncharacterised protein [Helicobacter muridarum]
MRIFIFAIFYVLMRLAHHIPFITQMIKDTARLLAKSPSAL